MTSKMVQTEGTKKKVCYLYNGNVGNHYYGQGHSIKPHRIHMTRDLQLNYISTKKWKSIVLTEPTLRR